MSISTFVSGLLQRFGLVRRRAATFGRVRGLEPAATEAVSIEAVSIEPVAVDFSPDDLELLPPLLDRLASLAIGSLNLVFDETCDRRDLVAAAISAKAAGFNVAVRGRATELSQRGLPDELESAGVAAAECLFLAAIDEIHDALAGSGDCRLAKTLLGQSSTSLSCSALIPLVPATLPALDRTLGYLVENQVRLASFFAIAATDDEPSNWALSIDGLKSIAARLCERKPKELVIEWYPPQRFDRAQTLAQQIRQGPRCRWNAIRVRSDGSVFQPHGRPDAIGNLLQDKTFVPTFQVQAGPNKCKVCACPECCAPGCLRDPDTWALM